MKRASWAVRNCLVSGVMALIFGSVASAQDTPADYQAVLKELGRAGDYKANVLKVNVPRNDLHVTIAGQSTPTPFGFGGWVALTKSDDGKEVLMGDLVLTQEEVNPVISALLEHGIEVTALHNHFFFDEPRIFFMHVHAHGEAMSLARAVKPALDLIPRPPAPSPAAASVAPAFNLAALDKIIGHQGEPLGPVYKFTLGRDDLSLKEHGASINARMGLNSWAAFAGNDSDAQIAGDIAMRDTEVNAVLKALRAHDLNIVAIHHHMLGTLPAVFFLHYWGRGPAAKLAAGFKAALNELGTSAHAGIATLSEHSSADAADIANAVTVTARKDCGCGQCAAKGCDPCHGKNCHYCVAKALVVKDCGCGGCDAKGCSMCGPGCDVCKFHLAPSATAAPGGSEPAKQP
jgi:hypothetical protein